MTFTCQVCLEQQSTRLPLDKLATGNGDVLRAYDCDHPVCQGCLATFVATRVQEQRVFNLRCPMVGCTNELFEQDLKKMVQAGALQTSIIDRFLELRARDYSARANELAQSLSTKGVAQPDFELIEKLWHTTRLCPRCSLIIERSQGCNSFFCICGHHFNFATAPRIVGNGIQNYGKLITFAKTYGISLQAAERYGAGIALSGKQWRKERAVATYRDVSKIAAVANLQVDDAWELYQLARSGDQDAQKNIRAAMGRTCARSYAEEQEEEAEAVVFYAALWDGSIDPTEHAQRAVQQRQNTTMLACENACEDDVVLSIYSGISALVPTCSIKLKRAMSV